MRRLFLLVALLLLSGGLALAQDARPTGSAGDLASQSNNTANAAQYQNPGAAPKSSAHSASVIRGCLSGSSGNYTLTDQNGMQYQVSGDDATLRSMVGREVEISGIEGQSSNGGAASSVANGMQASEVRAVSSTCKKKAAVSAPAPGNSHAGDPTQPSPSRKSPDVAPQPTPDKQ